MESGRRPTPVPRILPDSVGQRSEPESEPLRECIVLSTPAGDQSFTAERVVIGRAPTCDIVIADPLVSREHAAIRITDSEVTIEDLQSSNGLYVNHVRVFGPYRLGDGDRLLIGAQELRVFAVSSHHRPTLPGAQAEETEYRDPIPSTERPDPSVVLVRAAQGKLDAGLPLDAEQILASHLEQTLASARAHRTLLPSTCADAARLALALATALGKSSWFDYAIEIHYQAGLPMSVEIAGALAEAAAAVSQADRTQLERYVEWLKSPEGAQVEGQEPLLRFLETLHWPAA